MIEARNFRRAAGVAGAGAALTVVGFIFDASPLFVSAIAFLILGVGAPAWVWLSARGATVERHIQARRVVEDEPLEATIQVSRGPLGLPGGEVLDAVARTPISLSRALALIRGERTVKFRVTARFARRGLWELEPPRVLVKDTLALARTVLIGTAPPHELLVLPRVERVYWSRRGQGATSQRPEGRALAEALAAVEVDGLRPYRPGTPASRIHWPAVARGAGLLERHLRADGDARPLVVLDARGSGPPEHLDAAVRAAASLALELARLGGCGLLVPGVRRAIAIGPELGAWPDAHAQLALVEGGPTARAPALGGAAARPGPVFYVAARSLERPPPGLLSLGRAARVLVLPRGLGAPGHLRPSFEVAGCEGFVLGARQGAGKCNGDTTNRQAVEGMTA